MRSGRWKLVGGVAVLLLFTQPIVARAGESPIFVVGDWGIGKIDGRFMLYAGKNNYVDTAIPVPPRGPTWDTFYAGVATAAIGAVAVFLHRRRLMKT